MQTIDLQTLETVTGGTQTVASSNKLDDKTQQALTQLSSDIKDIAKNSTSNSSQLTQMMTFALMAKVMRG